MSFTRTVTLTVTPDEAFAMITEPDRLRRWQTISAVVDVRAGGEYRWTITPGHVAAGTYREVEPGRRIVFGWGWEGDDDLKPDSSVVTVTVEPAEGGSRVTLVHEGLTEAQAEQHALGWNHFLDRLQRLAATGDAGPDEWAQVPQHFTPVTAADAALAVIQPMLRSLTTDDRTKPTPCAGWTCHDVAEHLCTSLTQLGAMAGVQVVDPGPGPLETRVSVLAAQAIDAWRLVDLDGTVPGPAGSELPASFATGILPLELLLHGWDLAEGSGRRMDVPEPLVDSLRTLAQAVVPAARPGGSFADEVAPIDGATALHRLVAFAGRSPMDS